MNKGKLYLFAYSGSSTPVGYCHQTILIRGKNKDDARNAAYHRLKQGNWSLYLGEGKEVNYD